MRAADKMGDIDDSGLEGQTRRISGSQDYAQISLGDRNPSRSVIDCVCLSTSKPSLLSICLMRFMYLRVSMSLRRVSGSNLRPVAQHLQISTQRRLHHLSPLRVQLGPPPCTDRVPIGRLAISNMRAIVFTFGMQEMPPLYVLDLFVCERLGGVEEVWSG